MSDEPIPSRRLTERERLVYVAVARAARAGEPCPTGTEIQAMLGAANPSIATKILRRIADKGHITLISYAQSRVVTITRTGQSTRPPPNPSLHWRQLRAAAASGHVLDGQAPAPGFGAVKRDYGALADDIQREAFRTGRPLPDFLSHLVLLGWRRHVERKAEG